MNETKYVIEYKKNLNQEEHSSFVMLYAPLLSPLAGQLYLLLMGMKNTSASISNHRFLCESLHCSLMELTAARVQLEQFLLIKTYENRKENSILLEMQNPKCGNDFLRHEVLGRYYLKTMGSKMHQFVTVAFGDIAADKTGYEEITQPFQSDKLYSWKEKDEILYQKYLETLPKKSENFDLESFLASCSRFIFPDAARNKEALDCIVHLGGIYHISPQDMNGFVGRSMDYKEQRLKTATLRRRILEAYQPLLPQSENRYEMRPYDFLFELQNHIKLSSADAKILEDLESGYKLPYSVINVLIEHVLKTNNQKLDRSYIEKIAALWVRRNVDTYEKALAQCEMPAGDKKERKASQRLIPQWYNETESELKQASDQEIEELNELLKKMG